MAASIPVAAQVSPAAPPGIPMNPSPIGDTSAIAKEAQSWLADLIKIDTTNPPGMSSSQDVHSGDPREGRNQGGNSGI